MSEPIGPGSHILAMMASLAHSTARTLLAALLVAACGDTEPAQTEGSLDTAGDTSTNSGGQAPLFDEDGAWSLVAFDLGAGLENVNPLPRKDALLLHFDAASHVMTAAACGSDALGFSPNDSACRLSPTTTSWQCRCFSYAFEGDAMQMVEFAAGGPPPAVEFDAMASSDATLTVVSLAAAPEYGTGFEFAPLPDAVFGGEIDSRFIVQRVAMATFDAVQGDPEGRVSCAPCVP